MGWTRPTALAACSVLLLGVGACGGDPEPKFTKAPSPSATTSAISSPTPTKPTPPEMPAPAKKHTAAGAKAFIRYFWRTANYAQRTLDASALQPLLSKGCQECNQVVSSLQQWDEQGVKIVGGISSVSDLRTQRLRAGSTDIMRVTYKLTNTPQRIDNPGRKKDQFIRAGTVTDQFDLTKKPGGWLVISWTVNP